MLNLLSLFGTGCNRDCGDAPTGIIMESSLTTGGGLATGADTAPDLIGNAMVADRAVVSQYT